MTRELGISAPDQFSVFNVLTEVRNLVSSTSFQEIAGSTGFKRTDSECDDGPCSVGGLFNFNIGGGIEPY